MINNLNKPLISYCLFTYNQENYIKEAILSALAQTYTPLEIIISDDFSSDNSYSIIQEVLDNYKGSHKIKFNINFKNLGLTKHINKVVFDLADGEWIVMAAGDDISMPNRVENVWKEILERINPTAFQSRIRKIDKNGKLLNLVPLNEISLKNFKYKKSIIGAGATFKSEAIKSFGPLNDGVVHEDIVFTLRALLMGNVYNIKSTDVLWRIHGENLSNKIFSSNYKKFKYLNTFYLDRIIVSRIQQLYDLHYFRHQKNKYDKELLEVERCLIRFINEDFLRFKFCSDILNKKPIFTSILLNPKVFIDLVIYFVKNNLLYKIKNVFK